jgi:hypothetical protein
MTIHHFVTPSQALAAAFAIGLSLAAGAAPPSPLQFVQHLTGRLTMGEGA